MAMIFNDWARRPLAGRRAFGLRFGDRRDRRSLPERGRGPGRWSNLAPISRAIWADHGDVHPPQSGFQKKKDETKRNSVVVFLSACLSALVTFLLVRAVFFSYQYCLVCGTRLHIFDDLCLAELYFNPIWSVFLKIFQLFSILFTLFYLFLHRRGYFCCFFYCVRYRIKSDRLKSLMFFYSSRQSPMNYYEWGKLWTELRCPEPIYYRDRGTTAKYKTPLFFHCRLPSFALKSFVFFSLPLHPGAIVSSFISRRKKNPGHGGGHIPAKHTR